MSLNQEQLEKLIQNLILLPDETEIVEFKENNYNKEEVGKRISGLSNSANLKNEKYAYLIFGIKDKTHEIVGTSFKPKKEKIGNEQYEFWLQQHLTPKVDFEIYEFIYNDKAIVVFQIPPATSRPVLFNNIAYIRVGSATPKLQDFEDKERKIWNNIQNKSFEKGIAMEGLTASEVLNLLDYSQYFSLTKQELPSETHKFVDKMAEHKLVNKVLNDHYDITNLGAILFAKDLNKFPSIKRKAVRVILYKGINRVERVKEQEGSRGYAIAFEGLLEYIYDKLPYNEEISKSLRKEVKTYPEVAVREFVANALIHQDLSLSGAGPMVEIFDDRIEYSAMKI